MANRHDQNDNGPDPLILFVIISTILVIATLVAFAALVLISATSTSGSTSTEFGPYDVAKRPIPDVTDPSKLLPVALSDFNRIKVKGSGQDYTATYQSNTNQITISISENVSLRAAQATVSLTAQSNSGAKITNSQFNTNPSYFLATRKDPPSLRLVWSHDRWFFDVTASSQQALDAFMKVFKY